MTIPHTRACPLHVCQPHTSRDKSAATAATDPPWRRPSLPPPRRYDPRLGELASSKAEVEAEIEQLAQVSGWAGRPIACMPRTPCPPAAHTPSLPVPRAPTRTHARAPVRTATRTACRLPARLHRLQDAADDLGLELGRSLKLAELKERGCKARCLRITQKEEQAVRKKLQAK